MFKYDPNGYDPSKLEKKDYEQIPEGDHRMRISEVKERTFKSGNNGYEIVLDVNGYKSKIWYYLVINEDDLAKTNQRVGLFFDCFGITDYDFVNFEKWVGKVGGATVKHEEYNGNKSAKVKWLIPKNKQSELAPWVNESSTASVDLPDEDMPF